MFKAKGEKYISIAVFSAYLILLTWIVLFKMELDLKYLPSIRIINLIPFENSAEVSFSARASEIIYNVLIFIPFGIELGIFAKRFPFWKKSLLGFGLSFVFESLQYIFAIGVSDVTDLITNTFGTVLGVFVHSLFKRIFKEKTLTIVNTIGITVELLVNGLIVVVLLGNA